MHKWMPTDQFSVMFPCLIKPLYIPGCSTFTASYREARLAQRRQQDRARREQARSQETAEQREARLAQQRQ